MMSPPAALGIGTATFLANYGLPADPADSSDPLESVLRAAVANGVRYVDTAADYGDGEAAVGRAVPRGVRICTKIPAGGSLQHVRRSVERLGTAPDTILLHSAGRDQIACGAAIDALQEAKQLGLALRTGASTYGGGDAAFALAQPWVDVVQIEYSILNQSVLPVASRTRPTQEIVVRSVLCKGLLTSRRATAPSLAGQVRDALDGIGRCAGEWGLTVEMLAIRFALDTPGIDVVLVGVSSARELDTALAAAAAEPLTEAQWRRLAAFDRSDADASHPERWDRIR